jgi:hypothetical protein
LALGYPRNVACGFSLKNNRTSFSVAMFHLRPVSIPRISIAFITAGILRAPKAPILWTISSGHSDMEGNLPATFSVPIRRRSTRSPSWKEPSDCRFRPPNSHCPGSVGRPCAHFASPPRNCGNVNLPARCQYFRFDTVGECLLGSTSGPNTTCMKPFTQASSWLLVAACQRYIILNSALI